MDPRPPVNPLLQRKAVEIALCQDWGITLSQLKSELEEDVEQMIAYKAARNQVAWRQSRMDAMRVN